MSETDFFFSANWQFYPEALNGFENAFTDGNLPKFIIICVESMMNSPSYNWRLYEYHQATDLNARFVMDEVLPAVLGHEPLKAAYPSLEFSKVILPNCYLFFKCERSS